MQTIKVSKVLMNLVLTDDGDRWRALAVQTTEMPGRYQTNLDPIPPMQYAISEWNFSGALRPMSEADKRAFADGFRAQFCDGCGYQKCPDGCCCGC